LTGRIDYSLSTLPTLTENNLSEPAGIGDGGDNTTFTCAGGAAGAGAGTGAIDWNCDSDAGVDTGLSTGSGQGSGRIYTITTTCSDTGGGSSHKSVVVTVPKSQGR
jgi:hypothetical protein